MKTPHPPASSVATTNVYLWKKNENIATGDGALEVIMTELQLPSECG
jgi:hypothetical protein